MGLSASAPAERGAAAEEVLAAAKGAAPRAKVVQFCRRQGEPMALPCALVAEEPSGELVLALNPSSRLWRLMTRALAGSRERQQRVADAVHALWTTGRWPRPGVLGAQYPTPLLFSRVALGPGRLWTTCLLCTQPVGQRLVLDVDEAKLRCWEAREAALAEDLEGAAERPVDPQTLGSELIMWSPVLPWLIAGTSMVELIRSSRLAALSFFFGVPLIDRTGTLNRGLPLKLRSLFPIPPRDPRMRDAPLAPLMSARAAELLRLARERGLELRLLWSGGIDSTGTLAALLAELRKEDRGTPSPLVVLLSQESVDEYPAFHADTIVAERAAGRLRTVQLDPAQPVSAQMDFSRHIYVTGECGDQLFGSALMAAAFNPGHAHNAALLERGLGAPWREVVPQSLAKCGLERDPAEWCEWLAPQLEHSPVPVETVFDLLWWLNFSMKWQHVVLRCLHHREGMQPSDIDSVHHFYASDHFQQWSMENHHRKLPDLRVWSTYKAPLKEFIFEFNGDADYRDNKLKLGSLQHVMDSYRSLAIGIDDRFNLLKFGAACVTPARLHHKYGGELGRFLSTDGPQAC
eukprot:TRINITY_DN28030_c0_g1_i1.p1 TRINITY_DN28030_c0_g1~~TRINITY_DN28030_c0_g1_i1.p1  ORF type:complete len:575 (+),score=173.03 TRINITY_DN28030_c0_g1_i1:72-1796(+)